MRRPTFGETQIALGVAFVVAVLMLAWDRAQLARSATARLLAGMTLLGGLAHVAEERSRAALHRALFLALWVTQLVAAVLLVRVSDGNPGALALLAIVAVSGGVDVLGRYRTPPPVPTDHPSP